MGRRRIVSSGTEIIVRQPKSGPTEPAQREASGTVSRVVRLLQCLAPLKDVTPKDLSKQLELAPSTLHRLLNLLMQHDLVQRTPNGRGYQSGPELFRLASVVLSKTDIADIAEPFLRSVVDACNKACNLIIYQPTLVA
jgi:DNA-binding IclR family transcriptional regulator